MNGLTRDTQLVILGHVPYIYLLPLRRVCGLWKQLIDQLADQIHSYGMMKDVVRFRICNDDSDTSYLQDYDWEIVCCSEIPALDNQTADIDSEVEAEGYTDNDSREPSLLRTTLIDHFTRRFVRERTLLFNSIFKTNIPADDPRLFGGVRNIRVSSNEYSTFAVICDIIMHNPYNPSELDQMPFSLRNSSDRMMDLKDGGWTGLGNNWHGADAMEILNRWMQRCNHGGLRCLRDLTLAQPSKFDPVEWFGFDPDEPVPDFIDPDPMSQMTPELLEYFDNHTWIDHGGILIEQQAGFFGIVSCHILEFIMYQTQLFFDRHKIDWRTFSYQPYDIEKLLIIDRQHGILK